MISLDEYKLDTPTQEHCSGCGCELSHRDKDGVCKSCIEEEKADREDENIL